MTTCDCCEARPRPDGGDCDCNSMYCRRCLWRAYHCGCLVPSLVEDEELADMPAVVDVGLGASAAAGLGATTL